MASGIGPSSHTSSASTAEHPADLECGDPAMNAGIATMILSGQGPPGARCAVALNAAAAIYVSGRAPAFPAAVAIAVDALDRGLGLAALDRMRAAYAAHAMAPQ